MKAYTEQEIIEMIMKKFKGGIGNDAAIIDIQKNAQLLATCDSQVEGVHFECLWMSPEEIGYRSVAVAVSDIAAMGGEAKYILVSLFLPRHSGKRGTSASRIVKRCWTSQHDGMLFADQLFVGIEKACKMYGLKLIGGNLSSANQIVVDVVVLGTAKRNKVVSRSGARVGDLVMATGNLGDAAAGLQVLKCKVQNARFDSARRAKFKVFIDRFVNPTPRLKEGVLIGKYATAMIDVSDGLVKDLGHICDASGVGVRLFEEKIPVSKELQSLVTQRHSGQARMTKRGLDGIFNFALYGGEDYELLFTVNAKDAKKVQSLVKNKTGTQVTLIGEIVDKEEGRFLLRKNGREEKLLEKGWDHFAEGIRNNELGIREIKP